MNKEQIGSIWIAMAVGLIWIGQLWLGQETVAAVVATALGVAAVLRDAWAILEEPDRPDTRSTGPQRGKARRWLVGG